MLGGIVTSIVRSQTGYPRIGFRVLKGCGLRKMVEANVRITTPQRVHFVRDVFLLLFFGATSMSLKEWESFVVQY